MIQICTNEIKKLQQCMKKQNKCPKEIKLLDLCLHHLFIK